jgi:hypothetical protein
MKTLLTLYLTLITFFSFVLLPYFVDEPAFFQLGTTKDNIKHIACSLYYVFLYVRLIAFLSMFKYGGFKIVKRLNNGNDSRARRFNLFRKRFLNSIMNIATVSCVEDDTVLFVYRIRLNTLFGSFPTLDSSYFLRSGSRLFSFLFIIVVFLFYVFFVFIMKTLLLFL